MVVSVSQTHLLECLHCPPATLLRGEAPVEQRRLDVAERRQVRNEVELLEHEADGISPQPGAFRIGQPGHVHPTHPYDAMGRQVQDAQ